MSEHRQNEIEQAIRTVREGDHLWTHVEQAAHVLADIAERALEFYYLCGEVRGGAADYILHGEPS